VYSIIGL